MHYKIAYAVLIAFTISFFYPFIVDAGERVYTLNSNLKTIARRVIDDMDSDEKASVPPIVKQARLHGKIDFWPKDKCYRFSVFLLEPYPVYIGRLGIINIQVVRMVKTTTLWEIDGKVVVRSTVDIGLNQRGFPLRWVNPIKNGIASDIEQEILNEEEGILRGLSGD